ncbi:MAG: hypothetical protein WAT81_05600 [Candidatus Moraniibacteriota bacterium]
MEILYQICLTLLTVLVGAILFAVMSAFRRLIARLFFQTLTVLLTVFVIVSFVWTDFTLEEIVWFILRTLLGWGLLLGVSYLLIRSVVAHDRYKKALGDIETLRKRADRQQGDIKKLAQSAQKLGAPISREKIKVY